MSVSWNEPVPVVPVTLDSNDPFESALIPMVEVNRRKRRDYALDDNPFSNFEETANALGIDGFGRLESALFNCLQKLARLKSLRQNGRMEDPSNEAVEDTYLDFAVYSVILLAMARQDARAARGSARELEEEPSLFETVPVERVMGS